MTDRRTSRAERTPEQVPEFHAVTGNPTVPPFPAHLARTVLGLGCYWGGEKVFWTLPGVYTTAAGYAGGVLAHPTYEEVCTGETGHIEFVQLVYDPAIVGFEELLREFWENHDPTQGDRQGIEVGRQYRSAIFVSDAAERAVAERSLEAYQAALARAGHTAPITTAILDMPVFYYAAGHEQQYLAHNPDGPVTQDPTRIDIHGRRREPLTLAG